MWRRWKFDGCKLHQHLAAGYAREGAGASENREVHVFFFVYMRIYFDKIYRVVLVLSTVLYELVIKNQV